MRGNCVCVCVCKNISDNVKSYWHFLWRFGWKYVCLGAHWGCCFDSAKVGKKYLDSSVFGKFLPTYKTTSAGLPCGGSADGGFFG